MSKPKRIQLSRKRGYRKPAGAVVVARPTRWGNPFIIKPGESRADVVELYRRAIEQGALELRVPEVRAELAGKDLACWCPLDQPCHADVLLEIANREHRP